MKTSSFKTLFITEFRLLIRKTSFWLYPTLMLLMSVLVVSTEASSRSASAFDVTVSLISNLAAFQVLPLAWIAVSTFAKNSEISRDWLWTSPTDSHFIVLSQLSGLFLAVTLSSITALLAAAISSVAYGIIEAQQILTFLTIPASIILFIGCFELLVITSISLVFRKSVTVFIVIALLYTLIISGVILPYTTLTNPINYTLSGLRFDSVATIGAERPLIRSLLWLYMSCGITLVILAICLVSWRDLRHGWHRRHTRHIYLPLVVALASSTAAAFVYRGAVAQQTVPPPVTDQIDTWHVLQADHQGLIDNGALAVDSRLTVRNASASPRDSIVLRLNPGLDVTAVLVDDQPAQALRDGETVRIVQTDWRIDPNGQAVVRLSYRGLPLLLREDYSRANSRIREEPIMFARPVRTYIDATTVLLQRDGDWRAWPQTSAPYSARSQQIELDIRGYRIALGSGSRADNNQQPTRYLWQNSIPQLLLVAGDYTLHQSEQGDVYLPRMGSPRDYERALSALRMRQRLAGWLDEAPTAPYQAVMLPYAQQVALGGVLVGVPANARVAFSAVQDDTYAEAQWATGMLGVEMVREVLQERVAWTVQPLHTQGQPRSLSIACTYNAAGEETCVREVYGGNTPQAPYGRVVEPALPSPLLHAWSVVLGRQLLRDELGRATLIEEQRFWQALASPQAAGTNAELDARLMLHKRGLLPQNLPDQVSDSRRIAALVVPLEQRCREQGIPGLMKLLHEAGQQHPAGGTPFTEIGFRQLMQRL
ncbi:MAG TPA: ABC transporter permease [Roseiflexaceae bacterium]|nr:ABC transporter permease [Roseiflexaceae bacterium]